MEFTQTTEEYSNNFAQTEDWNVVNIWTEAPPNQFRESDVDNCQLEWIKPNKNSSKEPAPNEFNLLSFLRKTSRVVELILDEEFAQLFDKEFNDIREPADFVTCAKQIEVPSFLKGSFLFIKYLIVQTCKVELYSMTIIVIWTCGEAREISDKLPFVRTIIGLYRIGQIKSLKY